MARRKGGSAGGLVGLGVAAWPWGFLFAAAVVYYFWWFFLIIIGLAALTACYIAVHRAQAKAGPRPPKPPKPAKLPVAKPVAPPAPAYMPRWDGTRKWAAREDLAGWDRAFRDTAGQAEPLRQARPVPDPAPAPVPDPAPAPAPVPSTPAYPSHEEVFARLRSQLQGLE